MFFNARQQDLEQRSRQLLARSAALRAQLADDAQVLRTPLALADQLRRGWRWLKAHPQWVGVGVAVLVVWRPRRMAWLAGRLWVGWRLWQRLQRWRSRPAPVLVSALVSSLVPALVPALVPMVAQLAAAFKGPLAARAESWRNAARPPR